MLRALQDKLMRKDFFEEFCREFAKEMNPQLRIELRGNLAAMLAAAQQTKRSPETGDLFVPIQLVAGARNQHYLQLWRPAA